MSIRPNLRLVDATAAPARIEKMAPRLRDIPMTVVFMASIGIPWRRALRLALADWLTWGE